MIISVKMGKCYTILLLSALLVSSMSAPTPPDIEASRQNPTTTKSRNSVQQLIPKFSSFFEGFPLDQLKLLESAKDISEFQGILGALISDNKKIGENLFDMIDQLKDRYAILHGIIRGLIAKTDSVSGNEPNKGNIEPPPIQSNIEPPPIQSNGQSSSKNDVKSQLDEDIEKLVEQQLLAAMKMLPVEDLKRIRNLLAQGSDPSQILKKLQPAILSDELINVAVKYPSELKAAIDEAIFEDGLEGVTLATQPAAPTTVEPSKPAQTETVSDGQISVPEADKKENLTIKVNVTKELVNLLEPDDYETEIEELDGKLSEEEQIENVNQNIEDATQKEKESTKFINLKPQDTLIEDTPQQTPVESGGWFGAWHFLIIFLLIAALVGIGYLCTHNKAKIRAYIADVISKGRKSRNYTYQQVSTT